MYRAVAMIFALRALLAPSSPATPEDRLAGYAVALTWLAFVSLVIGLGSPYALVFVIPALYTWLWLPLRTALWARAALFVAGLAGPAGALVVLANELHVSIPGAALYLAGLASIGYVSASSVVLMLAWGAAAAQVATLAFGRYGPYAGGREPPPPGPVRTSVGRAARGLRGGRRYARAR